MRWNFIIIRFLKSAEVFLLMCWICAETLQEMRSNFFVFTFSQKCWNLSTDLLNLRWNFVRNTPKKALNFFQDLYLKCAEIILFYVFSRALKFFYGCAEFVLKLCKKWAEILLFHVFSKALNFSTDVLNLRWNFVKNELKLYYFTFSQEQWNFSTDVLNLG